MSFVTDDLRACVAEAEQFEEQSLYQSVMCGKPVKAGGVGQDTFNTAMANAKPYMSDEDIAFYTSFYQKHTQPVCCLPKGHSGKCCSSMKKYFPKQFANKLKDCDTTPGDDDILFKNRARRMFPIQVNKAQYVVLNNQHKFKANNLKLKAAVPAEFAGTSYTVATAHFDLSAILLLQKGITHKLPLDIEMRLLDRAQDIIEEFKEQQIWITNSHGYLIDPVLQCVIESEWYDNEVSDFQVQFGHVNPVSPTAYMTRGGNILPITRKANLIQSDSSIHETYAYILNTAELLRERGLSV